jgi:hypothetical protein
MNARNRIGRSVCNHDTEVRSVDCTQREQERYGLDASQAAQATCRTETR